MHHSEFAAHTGLLHTATVNTQTLASRQTSAHIAFDARRAAYVKRDAAKHARGATLKLALVVMLVAGCALLQVAFSG